MPLTGAQPQKGLKMLERKIWVAGNNPENPAPIPAKAKARIEREGTVDQRERHVAILAGDPEDEGSNCQDFRVFGSSLQRPTCEIDRWTKVHLDIARTIKPMMAKGGEGKCGTVQWIALDRLPEQFECSTEPVFLEGG